MNMGCQWGQDPGQDPLLELKNLPKSSTEPLKASPSAWHPVLLSLLCCLSARIWLPLVSGAGCQKISPLLHVCGRKCLWQGAGTECKSSGYEFHFCTHRRMSGSLGKQLFRPRDERESSQWVALACNLLCCLPHCLSGEAYCQRDCKQQ